MANMKRRSRFAFGTSKDMLTRQEQRSLQLLALATDSGWEPDTSDDLTAHYAACTCKQCQVADYNEAWMLHQANKRERQFERDLQALGYRYTSIKGREARENWVAEFDK